jgi:acylphosphatase
MPGIRIHIKGKVQGVWYRASTKSKAEQLGLTGWVKNLSDGGVLTEAYGSATQLDEFIKWCKEGPELAIVDELKVETCEEKEYPTFSILR